MARARGANAKMALAFETTYGVPPATGYRPMPFTSSALGEEQGLIADDLLGLGREPQPPSDDVVNNDGDVAVPVDLRNFGDWLKLMFGPPTTTQGVAASGGYTFSANPANNSTITVGGTLITFVSGTPTGSQVKIGVDLATTLKNLAIFMNQSADANLVAASYSLDTAYTKLNVLHDTIGTAGNSFTLAASSSPASNATASGSTLAGGSATGPYNHVFQTGALNLPSASVEIGNPEVPSFGMNFGCAADKMTIAIQRSGLLSAVFSLIAQGETKATSTAAGSSPAAARPVLRFSQAAGQISAYGVPLANIVSGQISVMNNLDKAENIRADGRIDGADAGKVSVQPQIVARFADTTLLDYATGKIPVDASFGYALPGQGSISFRHPALRLPKPKTPTSGPGGIQITFGGQGQADAVSGKSLIVTLVNDVTGY